MFLTPMLRTLGRLGFSTKMRLAAEGALALLAVGAISVVIGCGGGSTPATPTPSGPTLTSIAVSGPTNPTIGQSLQFTASGNYSDGSSKSVTDVAAWTTTNSTVATVANQGQASAKGVGEADITASYLGAKGTVHIRVQPSLSPVIQVTTPNNVTPLALATTVTFDGTKSTALGATIASYSWSFGSVAGTGTGAVSSRTFYSKATVPVQLTATTADGLSASTTATVNIEALDGTWTNTYQGQTRTLVLEAYGSLHNSSITVLGRYGNTGLGSATYSVEGSLGADPGRAIRVWAKNIEEPSVFDIQGAVSNDAMSFTGYVTVGGAKGQVLTFTRVR